MASTIDDTKYWIYVFFPLLSSVIGFGIFVLFRMNGVQRASSTSVRQPLPVLILKHNAGI